MVHGGFSRARALLMNFLIALTAVAGTGAAFILSGYVDNVSSILIPFAVGNFVYIAGADLIPELHHKDQNLTKSVLQLLTFMSGIGIMWLVLILNTGFVK